MIGQKLSHYRIEEKIGAGGMGVVYRARDERLDRDVALKVLPAGAVADDAARKRFRNEALTLSQLNHPNIATVHDFDTQDGIDFLVMERVAGVSLAQKLAAGPLPEKEIVALGIQIAEPLEEAHGQGVIHRDLKPGNVMVTPKGRAKVLDFGLAKLTGSTGVSAVNLGGFGPDRHGQDARATAGTEDLLTGPGAVIGTAAYMSPEQLRGESVDARTDIYALGAVLYEMATGSRPFRETQSTRLVDSILHQAPRPPRELNTKISPTLEYVILKALEKDPERRFQSAKEVAVDLRRLAVPAPTSTSPAPSSSSRLGWRVAPAIGIVGVIAIIVGLRPARWRAPVADQAGSPRISSLVVLPLANLSHDSEQEYFADGMTEELITDLAKIATLRVISRTSAMRYKGSQKPLSQIAQELKVDAIIEGSVLRSGERVRITAQLIQAATDRHLWAESYEGDLHDVLTLQSQVARAVANEIKVKVTPLEQARLATVPPVNPAAHEAYLKGRFYWNRLDEANLKRGIAYFEQAIAQDPGYAPAYSGLADSYFRLVNAANALSPSEAYPKGKKAAEEALRLDSTLAEGHASLAMLRFNYEWDWSGADQEFKRAIELNPSYAPAHHFYAHFLMAMGRVDESLAECKKALESDPLDLGISLHQGWHYYYARQPDRAIEYTRKALELYPNAAMGHWYLGQAYEQKGIFPDAITELRKAATLSGNRPLFLSFLAHAYGLAGKRSEAMAILHELAGQSSHHYVSAYSVATVYAGLGDRDQTFAWLRKAIDERSPYLIYLKTEPRLDPLRADPRFADLLRRLGLTP